MHTNQVVCLRYHPISGLVWTNKCLDIMILLVVWFSRKQIAGSDLLKDEFFKDFLGYVPVGGQLLLFFSVACEVVSMIIQSNMSQAVFQNIRKLYGGETDVTIHSGNCISTMTLLLYMSIYLV